MATDSIKVLIVERAGVELDNQEEFNLTAAVVPFSAPGYAADNVKDAIIESSKDIHSAQYIVDISDVIRIESKKQMRTFLQQIVTGQLIVDGWLIVD
jgi:hypothetical protein